MNREVISQSERSAPVTLTDSDWPAKEVGQRLTLLGDYTRLQLATTMSKVFEDLARRDPDGILKRSHEILELTQAADIVHGQGRSLMFGIDFRALFLGTWRS